jgi:uncharacterized membrane protein HdeD (DUF308 family)
VTSSGEIPRWTYWVFLVRGCVAFTLGASLLLSGEGLGLLASFVGGYWIVGALLTLHWAIGNRAAPGRRLGTLVGLIGLAAGIVLLLRELIDALVEQGLLLDVLGLAAIGMGLLRLSGKFHDDQLAAHRPRARYRLVVGTLDIVLGVAVLVVSGENVSEVRLVLGIWGLLVGTFLVLDALRLRRYDRTRSGAGA